MNIVVVGGGAMGTLFAARLSGWQPVWLLSRWTEHVIAVRRGLKLIELDGFERTIPLQAVMDPAEIGPKADLALICVKSPDTLAAAQRAALVLKPDGLALSLQNGLGNLEQMAAVVGEARVIQGVTSQGATLLGPGRLRHAGQGPTYLAVRPTLDSAVEQIAELFSRAGLETHLADNLDALLWSKLIVNVGINALSAILRVTNSQVAEIEAAAALMAQAVAEAAQVAEALGIRLPFSDPVAQVRRVAAATTINRSSMLADVLRGVPTEIEAINGAVVREGRRLGLAMPVNELLLQLVKAIEQSYGQRVS